MSWGEGRAYRARLEAYLFRRVRLGLGGESTLIGAVFLGRERRRGSPFRIVGWIWDGLDTLVSFAICSTSSRSEERLGLRGESTLIMNVFLGRELRRGDSFGTFGWI